MNATPHPFPGLASEGATDLSAEEALTDLGWEILVHVPGEPGNDSARQEPRFTVLHPDFGIALLDIAPEATPGAAATLCKRLDAAGAPPGLPVIQHSLTGDDLWRLTSVLDRHFASLPPLPAEAGDWPVLVRQVVAQGQAGAPVAAEPSSPAATSIAAASEEPIPDEWPALPAKLEDLRAPRAPAPPPARPAQAAPRGAAVAPDAAIPLIPAIPPAEGARPRRTSVAAQHPGEVRPAPGGVVSSVAAPPRPAPLPQAAPPFPLPQAARPAEAPRVTEVPSAAAAPNVGEVKARAPHQDPSRSAMPPGAATDSVPVVRHLPVVTPRPPVSTQHFARRRNRRRRLAVAALGALLLAGGVATALIGHLPGRMGTPAAPGERMQEAAIVPLPQPTPAPAEPQPAQQPSEAEVAIPPPLPSPPAARPAAQRSPAFRGEPLVPTPGPQPEAQRLPTPSARRVVVHHAPGLWDGVEGVVDQINRFGVPVERRVVGASTSRKIVRFFTQADQDDAEQLARSLGRDWMVQDFTSFSPRPRPGTLEVWLPAGAG